MNVNFFLKDRKKLNTAINCIIRYRGERYKLATGISVDVKLWDGNRADERKGGTDAVTVNIRLDRLENAIKAAFKPHRIGGTFPNVEELKEAVKEREEVKQQYTQTLLPYFENYYTEADYNDKTKAKYKTAYNWLEKYEKRIGRKLTFEDVTLNFYKDFRHWFFQQKRPATKKVEEGPYSLNYFGSLIKCYKRVMDEAGPENEKLHNNRDYQHKKFKVEQEQSDSIALTVEELMRMHHFTATPENIAPICKDERTTNRTRKVSSLNYTKNMFLIGAFTALRISDFSRLQEVNIKDNTIRIKPQKGTRKNKDVVIPMSGVVREILNSGFDLKKTMSSQRFNDRIKEVCQLIGLDEDVVVARTEGNRVVERVCKKYELVSSHTCRRSGATNMIKAGIHPMKVMMITGHDTWENFMKYIKIEQEENAEELARHPFFT